MAQELIITSVRKGLDGGSGYQPVMRTQGMKPAIAERLQIRCGYAHPYPHGDSRNPIVYFHRIEKVSGETLHVVARICDAGSDHTGRSNFLAHLVALQDSETKRTSAGPADAAQRLAFKTSWSEQHREVAPLSLAPAERAPGPCAAWRQAGLDPGIAGDLAEAASVGTEVHLITRQNDDVLSLFAEALALVPPQKRWQVTFNTCEIEPFHAIWRAVREDLPQAKSLRQEKGVVDLTVSGIKGSDRAFARFARGEDGSLPWQVTASPSRGAVTDDGDGGHAAAPSAKPPQRKSAAPEKQQQPIGKNQPLRDESAQRSHLPVTLPKRNLLEGLDIDELVNTETEATRRKRTAAPIALAAALILLVIGVGGSVAYLAVNPSALRMVASAFRADVNEPLPVTTEKHAVTEAPDEDPAAKIEEAEKQQEAEKEAARQAAADAKMREEEKQRRALLAEEQKKKAAAEEAKKQASAKKRKEDAFAELKQLPTIISKNLPLKNAGFASSKEAEPINLGSVNVDDLINFTFDLALPNEQLDGPEFNAELTRSQNDPHTWVINAPDKPITGSPVKKTLAEISISSNSLILAPKNLDLLSKPPFNLLRRCVLLLRAEDPNTKDSYVHPIQLVRPEKLPPTVVASFITEEGGDRKWCVTKSGTLKPAPLVSGSVEGVIKFAYKPEWSLSRPSCEYTFGGSSRIQQSLLVFSKPPGEPPVPRYDYAADTRLCVSVSISAADGIVEVMPYIEGVEANRDHHLAGIKSFIINGDRSIELTKGRIVRTVQNLVQALSKYKTAKDYAARGTKSLETLKNLCDQSNFRAFNGDFGSYFVKMKRYQAGDDREEYEQDPAAFLKLWEKECEDVARDKADNEDEWRKTFIDPLEKWSAYWKDQFEAQCHGLKKLSQPLYEKIEVRITKLTVSARASNGSHFPVVLLDAAPEESGALSDSKQDVGKSDEQRNTNRIFDPYGAK